MQVDAVESRRRASATALIATALATSPWACPPMPSATASRRELVYAESWFTARRRPMSDPAAERTVGVMGSTFSTTRSARGPRSGCVARTTARSGVARRLARSAAARLPCGSAHRTASVAQLDRARAF